MAEYLFLIHSDSTLEAEMTPDDWQAMLAAHEAFEESGLRMRGPVWRAGAIPSQRIRFGRHRFLQNMCHQSSTSCQARQL